MGDIYHQRRAADAETRIQTHAAPQCCRAIRGKRHDAAVRAASHPRSQNKHNSNQVTNKAQALFFLSSLAAVGASSNERPIIHPSKPRPEAMKPS